MIGIGSIAILLQFYLIVNRSYKKYLLNNYRDYLSEINVNDMIVLFGISLSLVFILKNFSNNYI